MVPSWAAKAAPVRPAMMMPVIIGAHLAGHADADQVGDVDLGAEYLQLHRAHEGQDQPDQKADSETIGRASAPALLQQDPEVASPETRPAQDEAKTLQGDIADEIQDVDP